MVHTLHGSSDRVYTGMTSDRERQMSPISLTHPVFQTSDTRSWGKFNFKKRTNTSIVIFHLIQLVMFMFAKYKLKNVGKI